MIPPTTAWVAQWQSVPHVWGSPGFDPRSGLFFLFLQNQCRTNRQPHTANTALSIHEEWALKLGQLTGIGGPCCKCAIKYVLLSSSFCLFTITSYMYSLGPFGRVPDYLFDKPFNLYTVHPRFTHSLATAISLYIGIRLYSEVLNFK